MAAVKKIALITGSTSGIGLNIAQKCAKAGNSVVLTGRGEQKEIFREILDFKKQYHDRVTFVHGDFTSTDSILELCKDVTNIHSQGVDILVNNAGFQYTRPIEKHDLQIWQAMLSVHMTAPFLLIQHFLPYMKRKGWGRIVNIAAVHGMVGEQGMASFCASKSGLIGLTKTVALECSRHGITCNAVCPGTVDTKHGETLQKEVSGSEKTTFGKAKAMIYGNDNLSRSSVTAEQVASLVSFLTSERAANITGTAIPIDGGHLNRNKHE